MANGNKDLQKKILKRLDKVISLLQHSLAVQLYRSDVSQPAIGKLLGIATGKVNRLLKGIKKEK
ncbi:hypothetical protein COT64_02490 [Candidatus Shapirobacteria bacterium CG09_land_8_20_14_0_10_39_12]|uniref:RNA polymerase sigma-70 region 4 domain-containing protein n=1 Tax=Candidatus Shapirobacteria bacterium CG09_land_8_20_14_0_10_39_12 TaxID=1974885 RepID=A0A2H0WP95_9BACT|nr:MAG: hypothetical protein COT64_02490 [Candidatus Shapirobacteria bacterium CG09_land_8_20_14_0_10_39_12]